MSFQSIWMKIEELYIRRLTNGLISTQSVGRQQEFIRVCCGGCRVPYGRRRWRRWQSGRGWDHVVVDVQMLSPFQQHRQQNGRQQRRRQQYTTAQKKKIWCHSVIINRRSIENTDSAVQYKQCTYWAVNICGAMSGLRSQTAQTFLRRSKPLYPVSSSLRT